jgi:hypothetical protein|tara:strand:+ start:1624 stop:1860 length:237 start_codon:yes stop_codon:yes gene_type:complete
MDVKVGKNKYQITLPIVLTLGAIIVSAVSWFTMLQVNMATMQSEIDKLNVIILNQEDKVQACLDVVDDYYELKRRIEN